MSEEEHLDQIVGLLYEFADTAQGLAMIINSISNALNETVAVLVPDNTRRRFIGAYLDRMGLVGATAHACSTSASDRRNSDEDESALVQSGATEYPGAGRLLSRLGPHLVRAAVIRQRMRGLHERDSIRTAELAHLPFGLVWVGPDLKITMANALAQEILQTGDGVGITNLRLRASSAADTERLFRAIDTAVRPGARSGRLLAIHRKQKKLPLLLSVMPSGEPETGRRETTGPLALVIMRSPEEKPMSVEHLQPVYGFTNAECRLVEALLNNDTLENYATRARVSLNTVRCHLAHIFNKTHTSRQAELVRLLMLAQPGH